MSLIKVRFQSDYITCSVSFSDNFKIHIEERDGMAGSESSGSEL